MNNLHLVLGGPGCGKTTRLLQIMQDLLEEGYSSNEIAFVTFNREAANVARSRAAVKFSLNPKTDLPWFRTIHSLAFASLGVQRDEIMDRKDWVEFSHVVNEELTGSYSADEGSPRGGRTTGDTLLRIVDYAGTTCRTLEEAWHCLDEVVDWYRLKRFANCLATYKVDTGKYDFTDLLLRYPREGKPLNVRVAIIDEAQDLTAAQWAAVRHAFQGCERVYAAGDDDQAIYFWAGADVPQFLALSTAPEVLSHSHRLTSPVWRASLRVAGRISHRYVKQFAPNAREGLVEFHQRPEDVNLQEDEWFLLARNNYQLKPLELMVREFGVNYATRYGPAIKPTDVSAMVLYERLRSGRQLDMSAGEYRLIAKMMELPKPQTRESRRYTLQDAAGSSGILLGLLAPGREIDHQAAHSHRDDSWCQGG
jgi:superfamily I DNA/RNA helicase